jgi:putative tryptophan/tyrosine transport system substrate-binding protein
MRRREFITLLGGTATWPLAARSQDAGIPVVGFLSSRSPGEAQAELAGFRRGLADAGYFENQNLAIEYRWAEHHYERIPAQAADLVARRAALR